jgi:uncharacterized cupin superfamily protein
MIQAVPAVAHWDRVEAHRRDVGHLRAWWTDLGSAAGSVRVGLQRIRIDPERWSTPAHVECAEEEIFYVLGGTGLSWQDGRTYEVGPGDCLVHLVEEEAHTLRAGPDGLDVLAFGMRVSAPGAYLPRAGIVWHWPAFLAAVAGKHPFEREADAGEPEVGSPVERPPRIVATLDVPQVERTNDGGVCRLARDLGRAAGSALTGLQHVSVPPGKLGAPPHCHSADEEIFVVLEGGGTLLLGDEEHLVRPGSVVARPPATHVAHALSAGDGGLVYLAYGTREPNDIAYYPRSGKISFRGIGVIARLEQLDYWDGEP